MSTFIVQWQGTVFSRGALTSDTKKLNKPQ